MDVTTIGSVPASGCALLAELALCGQDNTTLRDASVLASRIAGCVSTHLSSSWGIVLLPNIGAGPAVASWGLDDDARQQLLTHNGYPRSPEIVELDFEVDGASAGSIRCARSPHLNALMASPLADVVRHQVELLIRLHRRECERARRESVGQRSLELLGILDLRVALQALCEQSAAIVGACAATVFLVGDNDGLVLAATQGLRHAATGAALRPGAELASQAAQSRLVVHVPDYASVAPRSSPFADEPWGPVIALPLLAQGTLVGVLLLARAEGEPPFDEADHQLLAAFVPPVSLMLRNAQLFSQQHQRARELFVLYENGHVLNTGLEVEPALARVVENITSAMNVDRAVLHLADPAEPSVLYEAAAYDADGSDAQGGVRYTIATQPEIARLLNDGDLLVLGPPTESSSAQTALLRFLGFRSALLLVLRVQNHTLGWIGVGYTAADRRFTTMEMNLARTFASQAAAAIANAQLYAAEQQRVQELEQLQRLSQRLDANLDLPETLGVVLDGARSLVPFAGAQISLYNPTDQTLVTGLASGIVVPPGHPSPQNLSEGLSGWVARYRRSLRLDEYESFQIRPLVTMFLDNRPIRSYLAVPLTAGDDLVGILEVFGDRPGAFVPADDRMLTIVAGVAARAIAAARRHERTDEYLRSRLQQLIALQRVSRELTSTLSLDHILTTALNQALRATPATQAYIALREGGEDDLQVIDATTGDLRGYVALGEVMADNRYRVLAAAGYGSTPNAPWPIGVLVPISSTIAGEALSTGREALADELRHDDRLDGREQAAASALAMPIFYEDHVVGVVNLQSRSPRAFNHDTLEFVRALADQASLAINNAYRYDEQRRQRKQLQQRIALLSEVLTIGQALRADRSLEEVLEQIAFSTIEAANFRSVVFNLPDPDDPNLLRVATGAGLPLAELDRMRRGTMPVALVQRFLDKRFRIGRCFYVPAAAVDDIAMNIPVDLEAFSSETITDERRVHEWQAGDVLVVPLYSTGARLIGLMSVDDPFDRQQPNARSVEPLEVFADQAALAIENADLLREARIQTEQMTALYRVSAAAVSTLELDDLLRRVSHEIGSYMGTPTFLAVCSYDPRTDAIRYEWFEEEGQPFTRYHKVTLPRGGLTGWIIDKGQLIHIDDLLAERDQIPIEPRFLGREIRSWIGIPLRSTTQIIGVLTVQSVQPYAFNERHIQFLSTLANQLAVALQNVRLFAEREQRIDELDVINRIGSITNSTLNLRQMLGQIYDCLAGFLTVDSCFVFIYGVERHEPSVSFQVDQGTRAFQTLVHGPSPGSLTERIIQTRLPLLFGDLVQENNDPTLHPSSFGNVDRASAAWMGVPLLVGESETVGVLAVQSYQPHVYGERELAFLTTVANQVALGVQNARLFAERERQIVELDALGRVGRVTSLTLDLRAMSEGVSQVVREVFGADAVNLTLFDRTRDRARVIEIAGDARLIEYEYELSSTAEGRTPAEWIVHHSRLLRITDPSADGADLALAALVTSDGQTRSFLGIPIVDHDGAPIGALAVRSRRAEAFDTHDESLLYNFGAQISLGVQNAELFAKTQEQVSRLNLLNQVSSVAATTLDTMPILQTAVETMARLTGADQSRLAVFDREQRVARIAVEYRPTETVGAITIPLDENPQITWLDENLRPLVVYDAQNDPLMASVRTLMVEQRIGSIAIVPLVVGGRVIGTIGLDAVGRQHRFDPQDIELCQTIATQAASALEKGRLFNEAQNNAVALSRKVGELSTLLEAAQALSSSLKPREVLDRLMAIVGERLHVDTVALWTKTADDYLAPEAMLNIPREVARTMHVPIGTGLTGRVASLGEPLTIVDVEEHGGSLFPDFQRANRLTSFLGVPVRHREHIIGVLSVMTTVRREFGPDEVTLLAGLADQAAIALENARLFEERERRIRELTMLNRMSQAVNATFELDALLVALHQGVGEVLDTRDSFVALYDESTRMIRFPIWYDHGAAISVAPSRLGDDDVQLSSRVITDHTSLLLRSRAAVETISHEPPERGDRQISSWLGVPILQGERVLGLINVQSYDSNAFDDDDQRFLETVASQAATAVANARLFAERERRLRELSAIKDIGSAITSTLDQQNLLERLRVGLGQVVDVSTAYIALYNRDRDELTYPIAYDNGEPIVLLPDRPADAGTHAWVFEHRQPILVGTAEDLVSFGGDRPGDRIGRLDSAEQSFLIVPILSSDGLLGVINIQSYERYAFSQDDLRFVATVAGQASVAITNARLFQMEQRRREQADTLRQVAAAFTSLMPLDRSMLLILDQLQRVVPYRTASLMLREGDELWIAGAYGFDAETQQRIQGMRFKLADDLFLEQVVRTGRPVVLADAQAYPYFVPAEGTEHIRGWIGAPLLLDDEVIGLLNVDSDVVGAYSEEDGQLAFALASQAAQALHNARLYEQVQQLATELEQRVVERTAELYEEKERLQTLHTITLQLTASMNLDEALTSTLKLASRTVGVNRGSIMLRDLTNQEIICRAVLNPDGSADAKHIGITFERGPGLVGWVMEHQEPILLGDVRADERWLQEAGRADEVRSAIAVPLMAQDKPHGVLMLASPQRNYFNRGHLELLTTIANEIAIVINNASLYSYINDMATQLSEKVEQQREDFSKTQAILQSLGEGVIVLDGKQRVILFNPAVEQMLNIPGKHVLVQPLSHLAAYGDTDVARARSGEIYNGLHEGLKILDEHERNHNRLLKLANPGQTIALNFAPVIGGPSETRYGSVVVLRDITLEIEADKAKREFISSVSHELRTPLTSIKGYVDLLLLGAAGPVGDGPTAFLNVVKNNTIKLMELINDLLEIGRIDSNRIELIFELVDVPSIIQDVVQTMRAEIDRKAMEVSLQIASDLPRIEADQRRMTQVMTNLLSNAVKYTYTEGKIQVRAYLNPAGMLEIDIEDNGVGISQDDQKLLFRRFYRADNPLRDEAGGTGLGLSIAKSLVELHSGEMWVRSEVGQGSTFSLILPLTQPERPAPPGD